NFHPGSHLGALSDEECLDVIAEGMKRILGETAGIGLLVEGTSGQGNHVGHRFEHLARILERLDDPRRSGVCLDTCHMFAAGYDLRTAEAYEKTMARFEEVVGRRHLRAAHLNDAKAELGSRRDRHESIGKGKLGLEAFRLLMNDPRFDDLPLILETIDENLWPAEIALLYSLAESPAPA
ncbi:MAG: deoxyribonuclease IV, partial [Candidatus Aminicenantes bacterium]|nr:deoxyribonuclease IV [Candidatus Aminicenantes bacterium]